MENIWGILGDRFTKDLPRLNAVYIKPEIEQIAFAYPHEGDRLGYHFEFTNKSGYNMPPKFTVDFNVFELPGIMGHLTENRTLLGAHCSYPELLYRDFEYTNLGLIGKERFGIRNPGAYTWELNLICRLEGMHMDKKLFSVLTSPEEFFAEKKNGGIEITFSDMKYYIACNQETNCFVFPDEYTMRNTLEGAKPAAGRGHYLAIEHHVSLATWEQATLTLGLSDLSMENAQVATDATDFENIVSARWNAWFNALPALTFNSEEEKKLYYKCWWTIKSNYYKHPDWGHSVTEALPVYKGIWQWAIPSVEWHSDQNCEYPSVWIKTSMDLMLDAQREDGYTTHAIYVDDTIPGEIWLQSDTVQTPHYPWVALRYYHITQDIDSLRRWYPKLLKYYEYLCKSRDEAMLNKHLWAITTAFDTGLDTFPAFQRVTYGENGEEPERYAYASILSAERFRYEQSLGAIADVLSENGDAWRNEAEKTRVAMDEYLWDEDKKWYGMRHEDGTLDTRVGMDGMFALVYGVMSSSRAAQMEENILKLIGEYGIRTMAPDELGYREDVYWRGASWPKSCSVVMAACQKYFPQHMDVVYRVILKGFLQYPNIWECYNARTGELAHSDQGFVCSPGVSSNVGAGDIIGSLWMYHGMDMYGIEPILADIPMRDVHFAGMRVSITDGTVTAHAAECESAEIILKSLDGTTRQITV